MNPKQSATQPAREMSPVRLEGFSDGVLAVIITIMVLELQPPTGSDLAALGKLIPKLLIYVLSFVFIAIYWNNHHHLLRATRRISSGVMWANFHLLFWLSLVPLVTAWVGAYDRSRLPVAVYGLVDFLAGITFFVLTQTIRQVNSDTRINQVLGWDPKSMLLLALYALGIALAFIQPVLAYAAYALVAIMWFIPDNRLAKSSEKPGSDLANDYGSSSS
jgi:uncharacterized membrane protein